LWPRSASLMILNPENRINLTICLIDNSDGNCEGKKV